MATNDFVINFCYYLHFTVAKVVSTFQFLKNVLVLVLWPNDGLYWRMFQGKIENVFFFYSVEWSIYISVRFRWLIVYYLVPQLLLIFCSRCVIHYWKQGIDSKSIILELYFFLQFCQFCFIFGGVFWYIFYSCYMFLMEWTCHYIVPFASCDSLDLKFILCDISIAIPDIAFPLFWL